MEIQTEKIYCPYCRSSEHFKTCMNESEFIIQETDNSGWIHIKLINNNNMVIQLRESYYLQKSQVDAHYEAGLDCMLFTLKFDYPFNVTKNIGKNKLRFSNETGFKIKKWFYTSKDQNDEIIVQGVRIEVTK